MTQAAESHGWEGGLAPVLSSIINTSGGKPRLPDLETANLELCRPRLSLFEVLSKLFLMLFAGHPSFAD